MKTGQWVVIGVALGMIAATAGCLKELQGRVNLGASGVKVQPAALYEMNGQLVAHRSVVLPANVPGFQSKAVDPTPTELTELPQDTTFGRRLYTNDSGMQVQLTAVLMGTDHTSIHQPQYCLYSQAWNVTNTERINLRMERPYPYDIPAIKLIATHALSGGGTVDCIYVYWFVSGDKVTAEEGSRLWSMWKTVLQKGVTERWAYVSYFTTCQPGREGDKLAELQKLIKETVPEFQTVAGERIGPAAQGKGGN
jgi:hypothetical protein